MYQSDIWLAIVLLTTTSYLESWSRVSVCTGKGWQYLWPLLQAKPLRLFSMFVIFLNAVFLQGSLISFFPYVFYLAFARTPRFAGLGSAVRERGGPCPSRCHLLGPAPWGSQHFPPRGSLPHRGGSVTLAVPAASKEPLEPSLCLPSALSTYGGIESQLHKWALFNSQVSSRQLIKCV